MSDTYGAVTVDDTADVIVTDLTERRILILKNVGSQIVYLGLDANVTTSNGFPINPQGTIQIDYKNTKRGTGVYGITGAGTSSALRYLLLEQ